MSDERLPVGDAEYLLSYGNAGDFGRFRWSSPSPCARGDWAVVRTPRGQELGAILRPASAEHSRLLADQFVGQILRLATEGDLELVERMRGRSQELFEESRRLVCEFGLPMEILDAEVLLDGRQGVVHYLRWADCDPRPFMDVLSQRHRLLITLHDLALPSRGDEGEPPEETSCGEGDCGAGGCGSCSTGNCASCGHHGSNADSAPRGALSAQYSLAAKSAVIGGEQPRIALL
ncbi:MAG TPA: PSP1 domain-containing protein [Gemmataceae bacterium]|nr:PSP1 domain-containing protein [Gemmataceae bacterium]